MIDTCTARRAPGASAMLLFALAIAVIPACNNRVENVARTASPEKPAERVSEAPSKSKPVVSRPAEPPKPEPAAVEALGAAVRRDAEVIRAECARAAKGDWERWQRETAPQRAELRGKLDALKTFDSVKTSWLQGKYEPLEGKNNFPLFEIDSRLNLIHLYSDDSLDGFRKDRPVVAVRRWLRERGIDLIFVSIPKMTEIYIEHFLDSSPPDGIIAPRVRLALLELLQSDVEVVDGYSLFRPQREPDPEYLYNTADSHWAPKAMRIMAREVAARIARYSFGAKARSSPCIVTTKLGTYDILSAKSVIQPGALPRMNGFLHLNERQQALIGPAQTRTLQHVTMPDGSEPPEDRLSPVMLIGNSFVPNFREQLILESNLLIRTRWIAANTTQIFSDFVRDPDVLDGCRVLIWIVTEPHMTHFKPLPVEITAVDSNR